MKKRTLIISLLFFLISTCGCSTSQKTTSTNNKSNSNQNTDTSTTTEVSIPDTTDMFSDRDYKATYDENNSIFIELNETSATCSSNAVQIDGSTITLTKEATYILSGTLNDGMIVVNAGDSDKLQLVLNGVSIHSETSAALYIYEADKVFVTLADGTTNTLSNGGTFTAIDDNNIDGTIFSKQDLTLNGSGSLTVTSPNGHGIVCKDDLVITEGTYVITSASHGSDANDSIRLTNATMSIESGKDGMHAENSDDADSGFIYANSGSYTITSQTDGISGQSYVLIDDGSFDITSGGGSSNSVQQSNEPGAFGQGEQPMGGGQPADLPQNEQGDVQPPELPQNEQGDVQPADISQNEQGDVQPPELPQNEQGNVQPTDVPQGGKNNADMNPGNFDNTFTNTDTTDTSMKGIKSGSNLIIQNGAFSLNTADDAIHGTTSVTINGGTFIGTGSTMMAQNFSSATQGTIYTSVATQDAGTAITLTDSNGNVILSCEPTQSFALILLSAPEITQGETYTLTVGEDTQTITAQ